MTSDPSTAFAPLDDRAAAMALPLDRISLRDHVVEVEIGAFQQERGTTQRVSFSLVVEVAPHDGAQSDDVDSILSYDTLTEAIAAELAAERLNLLETLAERIALRVLREPQAQRCFVRIEKLDRGPGALGVEIVRAHGDVAGEAGGEVQVVPLVVYLSNAALCAPHLAGWIDRLAQREGPAVLCVGPGAVVPPAVDHPQAQRRIDLLSIEQNAWALAARDARLSVVASRTELDWAMKHGALTVWAPSKIVLDSVTPPPMGTHAPGLASWFAGQNGASDMIVIGETPPETAGLRLWPHRVDDPGLPET
ncbi:dihydroneopterin aldolase [Oceaniglobus trochenteri]|uniref:dihydroneopterin aldolase n=1 Tax=Oceaniglobus trochenteri TaxID=2763260 RepID=UPI001CFF8CA4|nr:dihydroneopterin aldolase [Oceaniglobus trochenteri]